jgi:hypothetical protein
MMEKTLFSKVCGWLRRNVPALAVVAASLVWAFAALHLGAWIALPGWLDFQSASWLVLIGTAALLYRKPDSFARLYCIVLAWFLIFFMQAWSTGMDDLCTAKILVPIGDSAGYSFEASRIAHGQLLTAWGGYRFLSHSFFSVWTFIFSNSAALSHIAMAILAALTLTLSALAVSACWGALAAATFLTLCGQFFASSLGTYATETYGLSMALLGTAMILTGVRRERLLWQFCGLFTLSIALSARAGAFFVLPLVGIAFASMQPTWRKRLAVLASAACAVVAAMALNGICTRLLCENGTVPFDNFWFSLHGMLIGQTWAASAAANTTAQARDAALHILSNNPLIVFPTSWKAVRFFFERHIDFEFVPCRAAAYALTWLMAAGALTCVVRVRDHLNRTILAALAGIFISIPFVPPWDAGIRPYAATIPLQVAGVAVFIGLITSEAARRLPAKLAFLNATTRNERPAYALTLAAAVLALGIGLPLAFVATPLHLGKQESAFYEGKMWVRLKPGNYLRIVPDKAVPHSYVPNIRHSDYVRDKPGFSWLYRAENTAIYGPMPENVIVTRGDAAGIVFLIKDDMGETLPESIVREATLVHLHGDNVAVDKRLGIDPARMEALLDSVYLPWLTGYEYFYSYHTVLGTLSFAKNEAVDGTVIMQSQFYGKLETSREMFPRFKRQSDGRMLRLDMDAKKLLDDATGEAVKPQ